MKAIITLGDTNFETVCGCANCDSHTVDDTKGRPSFDRNENHMTIFARLSRITNMHGTPGQPKGRKSS